MAWSAMACQSTAKSKDWGNWPQSFNRRDNMIVKVLQEHIDNGKPSKPESCPLALAAKAQYGSAKDRKSTRLNSSHSQISYAVFCLTKNKNIPGPSPSIAAHSASRAPTSSVLRADPAPGSHRAARRLLSTTHVSSAKLIPPAS